MISDIHVSRVNVSEQTRDYLDRRLNFALDRFKDSIGDISVTLADINGPRGGVDKKCRIRIILVGDRKPIIAESLQDSLRPAIDLAADSASRAVARRIDKLRSDRRATRELLPV